MDVPAGVTQEEGNTGFSIHLLSAVLALIFLARRIQPFLSLVDREVEFCVLTISSFSTRWAFLFSFFSFSVRKIPFAGIELTSQRVRGYMVPLSYRGDRVLRFTYLFLSAGRSRSRGEISRRTVSGTVPTRKRAEGLEQPLEGVMSQDFSGWWASTSPSPRQRSHRLVSVETHPDESQDAVLHLPVRATGHLA